MVPSVSHGSLGSYCFPWFPGFPLVLQLPRVPSVSRDTLGSLWFPMFMVPACSHGSLGSHDPLGSSCLPSFPGFLLVPYGSLVSLWFHVFTEFLQFPTAPWFHSVSHGSLGSLCEILQFPTVPSHLHIANNCHLSLLYIYMCICIQLHNTTDIPCASRRCGKLKEPWKHREPDGIWPTMLSPRSLANFLLPGIFFEVHVIAVCEPAPHVIQLTYDHWGYHSCYSDTIMCALSYLESKIYM